MAKLTLTDFASLTSNETSTITTLNNNNTAVENALENTLSRDGTSPNSMSAQLDMNNNKIINLPVATQVGNALEYTQLQSYVDATQAQRDAVAAFVTAASGYATTAQTAASDAAGQATAAGVIKTQTQAIFDAYNNQYLGTFAPPGPTVDNKGNALSVGDLYYDSTTLSLRVWNGSIWQDANAITPSSTNTMTNKTMTLGNNTISGTTAQFNTALTDDDFATLTNSVILTNKTLTSAKITTNLAPTTSDGAALGSTTLMFSDLYLASGGFINFNNGDVTITHGTDALVFAGAANGYTFDNSLRPTVSGASALGSSALPWNGLFLSSGAQFNLNNGNVIAAHVTGALNFSTGDLRVATAGTTATSVATVGGTQTLTSKTLTSPVIASIVNTGTLTLPTATDTLVGRTTTDTLTNKTLTSPVINSPTGIVKADVGLGSVDNTSDATKNAAAVTLTNKTIAYGSNSPSGFVATAGNQTLTGGFSATSFSAGTFTTGTYTPAPASGNFQHATNNGAHTLAPPATVCTMIVEYLNGASAGALTTSGFTKVTGDTYLTTNAFKYLFFITKSNSYAHLHIQTLQ